MTPCHNAGISVVDVPSRGGGAAGLFGEQRGERLPLWLNNGSPRSPTTSACCGGASGSWSSRWWWPLVRPTSCRAARRRPTRRPRRCRSGRTRSPRSSNRARTSRVRSSRRRWSTRRATAHTTPVARLALAAAHVTALTPEQLLNETSIVAEHDEHGDHVLPSPTGSPLAPSCWRQRTPRQYVTCEQPEGTSRDERPHPEARQADQRPAGADQRGCEGQRPGIGCRAARSS